MVARFAHAVFALGLGLGTLAAPSLATASTPGAEGTEQHFAVVRITVTQADGQVLRATQTVPWGDTAKLELAGKNAHAIAIAVGEADRVGVSYARDGAVVLSEASVKIEGRQSTVVHSDEAATIAVRIVRTTARVQSKPM